MMRRSELLLLDGIGNVLLGALLLAAPVRVATWLGIPDVSSAFYASLFGAVLLGIGIALLLERSRRADAVRGLGLGGALVINMCFGVALAGWLLFGGFELPLHGSVILWAATVMLVGIGAVELITELSHKSQEAA